MSLPTRTIGSVTVLTLDRVLTYLGGCDLLTHLAGDGAGANWLLDMTAVDYIDSAGLGALMNMHGRLAARGGALRLLHVQPRGLHLLELTGLGHVLESFETEAAALASFPQASRLGFAGA